MDELQRGRESFKRRMWMDAFNALSLADEAVALGAEDPELLSTAAYLIGRDDDNLRALDRAYRAHLETGEALRAARAAFWLGFRLIDLGEVGRATGWLGRAGRLVEREEQDCVEHGYLTAPLLDLEPCDVLEPKQVPTVALGDDEEDAARRRDQVDPTPSSVCHRTTARHLAAPGAPLSRAAFDLGRHPHNARVHTSTSRRRTTL